MSEVPEMARPLVGAKGKRFTLSLPSPLNFHDDPHRVHVTVIDDPQKHGWITPGGGWCSPAVGRPEEGDCPSWRILVRMKRERRKRCIRLDNLIYAQEGWK